MKVQFVKLAVFRSNRNFLFSPLLSFWFLTLLPYRACPVYAQSAPSQRPAAKVEAKRTNPAEAEITKRIDAANAARASGDPAKVALANQRLIGLTLREMGQLRLLESAYPQAIELYRRSLDFEDLPDTRIDLAIAELQARRLDDAIAESDKALAADAHNPRGYLARGRALMRKQEFAKAAEALSSAVRIKPDIESLYSLGICLLATRDPADKKHASAVFQQMIDLAGDSGSLHVLFGRAYRDANTCRTRSANCSGLSNSTLALRTLTIFWGWRAWP